MSRRRLIFYIVTFVGCILLFSWCDPHDEFERGDRIKVINRCFATRKYATFQELEKAAYHEDTMTILQYIYDEEARYVEYGTQARVIMSGGLWVEVHFDDDGLRNWWIEKKNIEKIK